MCASRAAGILSLGSAGLATLLAATPALLGGQTRALVPFVYGGSHFPVVNLRVEGAGEARTIDDFGVALFGGGGLALQLTGGFALRAMAATARSDLRLSDGSTPRQSFRRTFVGGDLQFGFLNPSTIIPYVAVGAAAVKINPDGAGGGFTRFAPRAAIGVNVLKAGLPTAIMLEVGTWIYRFDRFGYDRIQADVTATLGLAFAIPF